MRITDDCMSCGMCSEECPVNAIGPEDRNGKAGYVKYVIDTDKCVECGNCIDICPANAVRYD